MTLGLHDKKKPRTRSLILVLLAWAFIGGQALLAAGSIYNINSADENAIASTMPWQLLGQSAAKMRTVATADAAGGHQQCRHVPRPRQRTGNCRTDVRFALVVPIEPHEREIDDRRGGDHHPGELAPEPALRLRRVSVSGTGDLPSEFPWSGRSIRRDREYDVRPGPCLRNAECRHRFKGFGDIIRLSCAGRQETSRLLPRAG